MTRIAWAEPGTRLFEAGVDRGVLYLTGQPGVPWTGLIGVSDRTSGGKPNPKYIDGLKVSNHAGPEQFQGTIEAFAYPREFEPCDGTKALDNGLRAKRQRRKSFSLAYRTKVGNDLRGLDHAYKIHILYNLRAEPADREYATLGEEVDPMTFSWAVSSRPDPVEGLLPTAYFEVDSRTTPPALLQALEDLLYGTSTNDASLPTAGQLIFLFDSFEDLVYDAGGILTPVFSVHDAGEILDPVTTTIDSGEV